MTNPAIDLIVLTYNEEVNLEHCLRSTHSWVQNIFVVDSGSTDRTVEIAQKYGAQVVVHEFVNQAQQFNWALENLPIQAEWILYLAADEYVSSELRDEIIRVIQVLPKEVDGLYMKYRMVFMDRWIRYGSYYPVWLLRLFRYGRGRSTDKEMDEHIVVEGTTIRLNNDFFHHDRKGLSDWLLKHEKYATRQARTLHELSVQGYRNQEQYQLMQDKVEHKRLFRRYIYSRSPLFIRAFLYFFYRYFFRLGFLDGIPGLIFHFLHACWYMFYVDAKTLELNLREQ